MRFLLDTNVLIPAEPTDAMRVEPTTPAIAELLQMLSRAGHAAVVHPASVSEVAQDPNAERARVRSILVRKYQHLDPAPSMSGRIVAQLGSARQGSNGYIDLLILSAVDANAVDYLVTEDDGIHRRARRVGLADRVLTVADATLTLRALFPTVPTPPPFVLPLPAFQLSDQDPIFASFRQDYPGFDTWLVKCKLEHRQSWVIETNSTYGGVCIVNHEKADEYGFGGKVLKVCSFKIADSFRGLRYGELMLKAVFEYAHQNSFSGIFVEMFPKHAQLHSLFTDFGFSDTCESKKGERVLLKSMSPPKGAQSAGLGALDFNIRYGPHRVSLVGANAFLVPIRPEYHRLLFPESEPQLQLVNECNPFGNGLRKAYLCHSQIRKLRSGDLVLFYRSGWNRGVTTLGVAEETLVSDDVDVIARYVGRRTVYSYAEIEEMASKPILAVKFRQALALKTSWSVDVLKRAGIMKRPPQSFMQIGNGALTWIATQLGAPL